MNRRRCSPAAATSADHSKTATTSTAVFAARGTRARSASPTAPSSTVPPPRPNRPTNCASWSSASKPGGAHPPDPAGYGRSSGGERRGEDVAIATFDSARIREKGTAHGSSLEGAGRAGVTPFAGDQEGLRGVGHGSESSGPEHQQGSRRDAGEEAAPRRSPPRLLTSSAGTWAPAVRPIRPPTAAPD